MAHQRIFVIPAQDNPDYQILDVADATSVCYVEPIAVTITDEDPVYVVIECQEEI